METINPMMSENIDQIATALSQFQGTLEQPKLEKTVTVRTKTGRDYSFKYADLSACVKAATPKLKENGLSVTQLVFNGMLATMLVHKSGQWIRSEVPLPLPNGDFQAYGSAITYLKRYSYCAILGIVADTDDDANLACGNTATFNDKKESHQVEPTAEMIEKALSAIKGATNRTELQTVWKEWNRTLPELFKPGAILYNEFAIKGQELNSKTA